MNGCEYYQELISRMLDRDLNANERAVLAEHLRTCDDCATVFMAFHGLSESISGQLEEPPESLSADVMASIRRAGIRKRNMAPLKKIFAAAACVAVILLAAGRLMPDIRARGASVALSVAEDAAVADADESGAVYAASPTAALPSAVPAPEVSTAPKMAGAAPATEAPVQPEATPVPTATPAPPQADYDGQPDFSAGNAAAPAVKPTAPANGAAQDQDIDMSFSAEAGGLLLGAAPETRVEISTRKLWTKLTNLLDGKLNEDLVPDSESADDVYKLVFMPEGKQEFTVYLYGEELYYIHTDKSAVSEAGGEQEPAVYLARCTLEDFMKFVDSVKEK